MEVFHQAPESKSFVPLAEHQSATPASFYSGPAVLHYHNDKCKIIITDRDVEISPALTALTRASSRPCIGGSVRQNGTTVDGEHSTGPQTVVEDVDVWVTSEYAKKAH